MSYFYMKVSTINISIDSKGGRDNGNKEYCKSNYYAK